MSLSVRYWETISAVTLSFALGPFDFCSQTNIKYLYLCGFFRYLSDKLSDKPPDRQMRL